MKFFNLLIIVLFVTVFSSCTNRKDDIRRELGRGIKANYANQYTVAIEHFEKVLQWDENNQEAYLNLGHVYFGMGKYEKAINFYDQAIAIDPKYGEAYRSRAQTHFALGDRDAACKDYVKAEELGIPNLSNYTKFCK